jgi:hypothetical protein
MLALVPFQNNAPDNLNHRSTFSVQLVSGILLVLIMGMIRATCHIGFLSEKNSMKMLTIATHRLLEFSNYAHVLSELIHQPLLFDFIQNNLPFTFIHYPQLFCQKTKHLTTSAHLLSTFLIV